MTILYDSGKMAISGRRARVVVEMVYEGVLVSYDTLYGDELPRWELYRDGNYPALPGDWDAPINEYMTRAADAWLNELRAYTPDAVTAVPPAGPKLLMVTYGPARREMTVRLNGVSADEPLTPKMARQAARIAHGASHGAVVSDGQTAYRLYRSSARKLRADDDNAPADYGFFEIHRSETTDRLAQINWIDQIALDIVDAAPAGFPAADLVADTLDNPEFELPEWFNDHDRELLIERVAHHLTS